MLDIITSPPCHPPPCFYLHNMVLFFYLLLQTNILSRKLYFLQMSVKVAVRVRPFNKRQEELKSQLCVSMSGATTKLLTPKGTTSNAKSQYAYDCSFWSFDQFSSLQDGYLKPKDDKYADQKLVFETLGKPLLDNAWEGYHCCLFAYGQTGSGKSYSMIGYGANRGIVPIACEEMFNRLKGKKAGQDYEVTVSMIEIYNEKVQDLLVDIKKRPDAGLQIRENNILGVYVQNATKTFVTDYQSIEALMDEGSKNRTIAATQMNATSSRAHTIISITFTQHQVVANKKTSKISVLNLVDLAGSERQSKTGATGDRLKEAAGINLSLTTLGQVISALAEKQDSKKKDAFIPYRNSALTRILQNALGGNSKTCMICAISPAGDNFEETLSTLRYADQAKKIKNVAVINETETDKIIKGLKSENERLKALLEEKERMFMELQSGAPRAPAAADQQVQQQVQQQPHQQQQQQQQQQPAVVPPAQQQTEKPQPHPEQPHQQQNPPVTPPPKKQDQPQPPKPEQLPKKPTEVQKPAQVKQQTKQHKEVQPADKNPSIVKQEKQANPQNPSSLQQNLASNLMGIFAPPTAALNGVVVNLERKISQENRMTKQEVEKQQKYLEQLIRQLTLKSDDIVKEEKTKMSQLSNASTNLFLNAQQQKQNTEGALYMSRFGLKNLFEQRGKNTQEKFVIPPFLENVSKDIMTNRKVKIFLAKKIITVGKYGAYPLADIVLAGRDVQPFHAEFHTDGNRVYLTPYNYKCLVYRNGQPVKSRIELRHLDRIVFGWNSLYLFKTVDDKKYNERIKEREVDWDFFREEMKGEQDIDQSDTETGGEACCLMF